jgi:hypothetical protein
LWFARLLPDIGSKEQSKTPDRHVVKSIITAKTTPKVITAADSVDEIAAGADG